jgi:3-oxo-5alpha-steroid 4-dehydrogenase
VELNADVVVVGFGAAGACAALEAAGALEPVTTARSVIVVERFSGGGATALSGGVVYAGGGTVQQRAAGVADTAAAMEEYLAAEVGDAASPGTLKAFCQGSADMLAWLEARGVPFEGSLCPDKTSYPSNKYYLYYSGSELSLAADPAPRGHRAKGRGTSGRLFYNRLSIAVRAAGVRVVDQTTAVSLLSTPSPVTTLSPVTTPSPAGGARVTGVECLTLRGAPLLVRLAHRFLHRLSVKPNLYAPKLGRLPHRPVAWLERRYARPMRINASRGVVLTAGGFGGNRPMLREHAPQSRGGLPLATSGDDGSGIRLGVEAGGVTRFLDRVSVWRFLTPPQAFGRGILVGPDGKRLCDESRYGAAIGDAVVRRGGKAWLLVDSSTVALARRQLRGSMLWFQRLQGWYLLATRVTEPTVMGVAVRAGIDPDGLAVTVEEYNGGPPDAFGKPGDLVVPVDRPPYSLIDCSVRPRLFYPAPVLTLGGLVVSESSGQVLRDDGSAVAGLYAAGRTAAGLCSHSYVSGLSLADCVFSGRRAGRSAAMSSEALSSKEGHAR